MALEEKLLGKSLAELSALLDVLNSPIPETIEHFLGESESVSKDVLKEFGQVRAWFNEVRTIATKQKADNLRFRIVASVMGMLPLQDAPLQDASDELKLEYYSGDLTVGGLDTFLFLLLPRLTSEKNLSLAIDGLNEVYDRYHEAKNWVVDFSAVQTLPKILLGQLVAYRTLLRQKGRELYICWLKETAISTSELTVLTEQATLNNIGGMFFSEPVK